LVSTHEFSLIADGPDPGIEFIVKRLPHVFFQLVPEQEENAAIAMVI
jgi:hypothetical protein